MIQYAKSDLIRRFFDGKRKFYSPPEINRAAGLSKGFLQRFLNSDSDVRMSDRNIEKLLPILKELGLFLPSERLMNSNWID